MSTTPRYREIADELRDLVLAEQELLGTPLTKGARLPTEPELCEHYQVSRGTIRQALAQLAAEGLIETRGRRGTFVRRLPVLEYSAHAEHPDRKGSSRDAWDTEVQKMGGSPSFDFSFRIIPASSAVAKRLRIKVDELVVVRAMMRYIDGIPWLDQVSYYPYDVARAAGIDVPHNIESGTVRALAAAGYREIGWEHEIASRPATQDEIRTFNLAPGVAVLVYQRTAWTNERPVRLTSEVLPADRNRIRYEHGDLQARPILDRQLTEGEQ